MNPNAPRVEFFTSDSLAVEPGDSVTLFWSTRTSTNTIIYQLDRSGERTQVWNVQPDGSLVVRTRSSARGQVDFELVATNDRFETSQFLSIPLQCPVPWFFIPSPSDCPDNSAEEIFVTIQSFERGRMVYLSSSNVVYALFNDEFNPAWIAFQNRYDPTIHAEFEESFVPPPGLFQPIAILGFLWRGNDTVRNRLGLGIEPEFTFSGFTQSANDSIYISGVGGEVIQLLPSGDSWQIITLEPAP